MTYAVVNSRRAERDIYEAAAWWAEHRSAEQADRWLTGIHRKIRTLSFRTTVAKCPLAAEHEQFTRELRVLFFGLGRKPTHRIIFTVAADLVLSAHAE